MPRATLAALCAVTLAALGCEQYPSVVRPGRIDWSRVYEGDGNARVNELALDAEGNVLAIGTFTGSLRFESVTLTSRGATDVFVAKLDRDGRTLWARSFGSPDHDRGASVAADPAGNLWTTGEAASGIDFGSGELEAQSQSAVFLAKLDPGGGPLFSQLFGDGGYSAGSDLAVDGDGNVLVTGSIARSADFGAGPVSGGGSSDAFVAEFAPDGSCLESRVFGDADVQAGVGIALTREREIVLLGRLGGTISFGGESLSGPAGGNRALFVAKLDRRMNHIFSTVALSSGSVPGTDAHAHRGIPTSSHSIAARPGGGTILTGAGGIDFSLSGQDFEAPILATALLQEFGRYGERLLEGPFASGEQQDEGAVAVAPDGRVSVAGSFLGSLDFGSGPPLVSAGGRDIFLARFDAQGRVAGDRFGDAAHSEIAWTIATDDGVDVVGGWVRENDNFGADRALIVKFNRGSP